VLTENEMWFLGGGGGGGVLRELVAGEHFGKEELRSIMKSPTMLISVLFFKLLNRIDDV
jgi:hypothetical protein